MKKTLFLGLAILLSVNAFGQINMIDSTAQVIGYWDMNEKQTYSITEEKIQIEESDTISRDFYRYMVDVTIVDSTADSYLIDWHYRDYDIQSDNELMLKLSDLTKDITVRIRTDGLGVFQEVINWEELRDYILEATKMLYDDTNDIPNWDKMVKQIEDMFSTKESIELAAVKEMRQFYSFHGAMYEYNQEYSVDMKTPNLYGGEPFDSKVTVWLDELNPEENNFVIRMYQSVDSEQLTNATYDFLVKMAEIIDVPGTNTMNREDIPPLTTNIYTASRIHDSGWVIYSIETKEVSVVGVTNIEERIIEIE